MSIQTSHINNEQLDALLNSGRQLFMSAQPYEHIIIDNFLREESYNEILSALPSPRLNQRSSDYIFAKNKFENPVFDANAQVLRELRQELIGERFQSFLKSIYDMDVFIDAEFMGGGLHQGGSGSFLDMHADFSRHPVHNEWVRELNVLLYLNQGYEESWGGHLEMRNARTGSVGRVAPLGNRMVIMLTKEYTLHGYNPIKFPTGRYRTSIAAYAYTQNTDFESVPDRSTLWEPQSGGVVKQLAARAMPTLVGLKRKLLGSSTAKRAKR